MSLSRRFLGAVERLLAGEVQAEAEINTLVTMETPESVTDCTESLLNALHWGLAKYGKTLIEGYSFFRTLSILANKLPHR
jgi:hypothetical protein